jgi:PhnB protein
MPPDPSAKMPEHVANQISHVALPVGHGILMGSDNPEGFGPSFKQGNNFSISINVESREEAKRLYDGLSAGGRVTMPIGDAPWGAYFGMWEDKFGVNWMVNYDERQK